MAWTPQSNYAAINATLKADPRYAAALQKYQQAVAANRAPTIAQQRAADDGGQGAADAAAAVQKAKQDFTAAAHQILTDRGIGDFERLGFNPDAGAVAYEPPDHSLRNMLISMGAIAAAGPITAAFGGPAAAGGVLPSTTIGSGAIGPIAGGTGSVVLGGAPTAGGLITAGSVGAGAAGAGAAGAGAGATGAGAAGAGAAGGAGSVIPPATYGAGGVVSNFANVPPDALGSRSYADLLRYGLPTAGGVVSSIIQANAEGKASDAQQRYLQQALDYQKESDLYKRGVDAAAVAKEAGRYADYQGRIGPFIDNGIFSNDRMAELLGLPARPGRTGGGGGGSGPPASQRVPIDAATQQAIRDALRAANSSDTPEAWDEYLSSHGDSSVKNWDYWKHRIDTGEGVGKGYGGAAAPPPTSSTPPPSSAPSSARNLVPMRAPDGSTQQVPADQVDYYAQRGAQRV